MPEVNIFCKLSFFVTISNAFSSIYEKHRFINVKIAFLSETEGADPAQQERKLKLALNTFTQGKRGC